LSNDIATAAPLHQPSKVLQWQGSADLLNKLGKVELHDVMNSLNAFA
jgi:hypothetical protein